MSLVSFKIVILTIQTNLLRMLQFFKTHLAFSFFSVFDIATSFLLKTFQMLLDRGTL